MSSFFNSWVLNEIIKPLLDIGLLTYLMCKIYLIMRQTGGVQLLKGVSSLLIIYAVARFLQLSTLTWILNFLAPGIVVGIAIVFQPELRKIFMQIGQGQFFQWNRHSSYSYSDAAVQAAEVLARQKRGALIVFGRSMGLKSITDTGTELQAIPSTSLLVTIFGHDTPLHDGAVVIQDGLIISAGCFLPLSNQTEIRKSFGTRHRAALGLSEETDAVILIASEESSAISLAYGGRIHYDLSSSEVRSQLKQLLMPQDREGGIDEDR